MTELARTALYDRHLAAGGRMVDFAGWEMPLPLHRRHRERAPRHAQARRLVRRLAHGPVPRRRRRRAALLAARPHQQRRRARGLPGAVHDHRRRCRRRPRRRLPVPLRGRRVPARRERGQPPWRLGALPRRGGALRRARAARRYPRDRHAGPAGARVAPYPRARAGAGETAGAPAQRALGSDGGRRQRARGSHRLHRRTALLRALRGRRGRPRDCGTPCWPAGRRRSAWARATHCASKPACRSTGSSSAATRMAPTCRSLPSRSPSWR